MNTTDEWRHMSKKEQDEWHLLLALEVPVQYSFDDDFGWIDLPATLLAPPYRDTFSFHLRIKP